MTKLNEDPYKKYLDHRKRLAELEAKEVALKKEKSFLLKDKPWYKRLSNWIGLFAILTPIIIFVISISMSKDKKEITVYATKPLSMVSFTNEVIPNTKILYNNVEINEFAKSIIRIRNTGTKAILEEDFSDGPIQFKVIIKHQNLTNQNVPCLLDINKTYNSGQINDSLIIISKLNPIEFKYMPSLLNKGDYVDLEIYFPILSNSEFIVEGKLKDGEIKNIGLIDISDKYEYEKSKFSTLSLGYQSIFFNKGWAITIFAILLLLSTLCLILILANFLPVEDIEDFTVISFPIISTFFFMFNLTIVIVF